MLLHFDVLSCDYDLVKLFSDKMNNFQKELLMGLFMDSDSVSTITRITVAIADVITENKDNLSSFDELANEEFSDDPKLKPSYARLTPAPRRFRHYYENDVRNFSNENYEATFKMKRSTVQALIKYLKSFVQPGVIPLDKKVHVFLMFIMSELSYNDVGKLFGLHKSSVSHIFHEIASHLAENRFNYISWPTVEEQHLTRIKVNSRFKIPNCVGFIDTCRLTIGLKRKKHDTILLQAVCDESLVFIDIHIGEIGKTKKGKVFKESALSQELQNFVEFDNHILGDSEYKLRMNLITPFTSEELLTSEEMKFNEVHWRARSYIQNAFDMLKNKICKLNRIEIFKPEFVNLLIYSACVLHNFILMHEGSPEVKEEAIICDDGVTMNTDIILTPDEKRQFLCNYINYIDSDSDTMASR